jgi:hypothetical protein
MSPGPRVRDHFPHPILTLIGAGCLALLAGCGGRARPVTSAPAPKPRVAQVDDRSGADSVVDAFRQGTDAKSCRNALKGLNAAAARPGAERPAALTDAERHLLTSQYHLDPAELTEVGTTSYTLLDAHYLEQCFLIRDAARALDLEDLSPRERAAAAFGWTVREVNLRETGEPLLPVTFVLRRAWGTSADRSLVFLALLRQLGIDGCLVSVPAAAGGPPRELAGAVIGKDIYVFDTRLGLPLPGPGGKGIATLAELRAKPEVLSALAIDDSHRYDVSADQLRRAELRAAPPLSALAPRMKHLENLLPASGRPVLYTDPAALLEQIKQAAGPAGVPVTTGLAPSDSSAPIVVLRRCLPPEEGGVDGQHRRERLEAALVPWDYFAAPFAALPSTADPGHRLRVLYEAQFVSLRMAPDRPRDGLLRGHYDEAINMLIRLREDAQQHKAALAGDRDLPGRVTGWVEEARQVYADLFRAERQGDTPALEQARQRVTGLWQKNEQLLMTALVGPAADPLGGILTYFIALAKHEQAERAQLQAGRSEGRSSADAARNAWKSAADWWETFLTEYPTAAEAGQAGVLRARALAMLNQKEAAIALLKEPAGDPASLETLARLYRVRQLQAAGAAAATSTP